ncbi:MAG: magnesium chelatase ATPase subunit I [Caulobacteraceae bacterium]|nr:magnesium chelatase ATPase subunit I [Caulobacter sp.]
MDGSLPLSTTGRRSRARAATAGEGGRRAAFPFSAIVGQEELKLALQLAVVEPALGGVLAFGDRGTGKTTAIRALAAVMPPLRTVEGCRFVCDPAAPEDLCHDCRARACAEGLRVVERPAPVVDLPLGATEDSLLGALDLEQALAHGRRVFQPGLFARAHRGFLYVDEVNLLEDHLVDLLLDVSASGENAVEREGLSVRHPARFVLVGSGNPEEGELRPQLIDRFGLCVEVRTPTALSDRVEILKRRDAYEREPARLAAAWASAEGALRDRLALARVRVAGVSAPDAVLADAAQLCMALGSDGLRAELTLVRAARALAALEGRRRVARDDLRRVAPMALRHRLRRDPLDESDAGARVARALVEAWGP